MSEKHILLVENDTNLSQSILLILQRAGYQVTATSSMDKTLEKIQDGDYHMLVADIDEPVTRDVIVPRMLHEQPSMPVVVLTELSTAEQQVEGTINMVRYLVKPVAPEDLLECIGNHFGNNHRYKPVPGVEGG